MDVKSFWKVLIKYTLSDIKDICMRFHKVFDPTGALNAAVQYEAHNNSGCWVEKMFWM